MIELRQTQDFADWLGSLKDKATRLGGGDPPAGRARIAARVQRLAFGHFGDVRPVGEEISELRIHFGPGWRVYFVQRGPALIVLLCRWRQIRPGPRHRERAYHGAQHRGDAMKTLPFDPADLLDDEAGMAAYLAEALDTGDPAFVADALGVLARARGMSRVARDTGLSRESLYRALSSTGNPELATLLRVVGALGLRLTVAPGTTPTPPPSSP